MYTKMSQYFNNACSNREQERKIKILLKYKNKAGQTVEEELNQDEIVSGSFSLTSSCVPSSTIELGGTISKDLNFTIFNDSGKYNGCKFQNGTAKPYFGISTSNGFEWCPLGEFIIDESGKSFGKTISLKACDLIMKFETKFDNFTFRQYTLAGLLENMCSDLGVTCNSTFANSGQSFENFDRSGLTYRDVLSYIASAAGGFAYVSKENVLEIRQINTTKAHDVEISPLYTRYSCEIDEEIVIDSVAYYMDGEENKLIGNGVYSIAIQNNVLFDNLSNLDAVLQNIYNKYNGFSYYPANVEYMGDPRIEPGDCILLTTTEAGDVYTFANSIKLTLMTSSTVSSPSCSVLDKGFFDNKKRKETKKSSGSGGGTQKQEVNPNLLSISMFTKATLPYSFVRVYEKGWKIFGRQASQGSGGVECLCPAEFLNIDGNSGDRYPRVWLPADGMKPGKTYTLSLQLRKAIAGYQTTYNTGCIYIYLITSKNQVDLSVSHTHTVPSSLWGDWMGSSEAVCLGQFSLDSDDWKWYSFTFDYPASKDPEDFRWLGLQQEPGGDWGIRGKHLFNYFIHKAKLEEGDKFTGWCQSQNEHICQEAVYDENGNITKTIKAKTQSLIAEYWPDMIITEPTDLYYDCQHGVTKAGITETDIYNEEKDCLEMQYMVKSTNSTNLDDEAAVFTKQYRDSQNNFYIDCKKLIVHEEETEITE